MTQTTARLKKDENGREYQEYSIISKLNDKNEVEHSYTGHVNVNANVQDPIMEPFGEDYKFCSTPCDKREYSPALVYKQTQEEHKRLFKRLFLKDSGIKTIETKIISYIK